MWGWGGCTNRPSFFGGQPSLGMMDPAVCFELWVKRLLCWWHVWDVCGVRPGCRLDAVCRWADGCVCFLAQRHPAVIYPSPTRLPSWLGTLGLARVLAPGRLSPATETGQPCYRAAAESVACLKSLLHKKLRGNVNTSTECTNTWLRHGTVWTCLPQNRAGGVWVWCEQHCYLGDHLHSCMARLLCLCQQQQLRLLLVTIAAA